MTTTAKEKNRIVVPSGIQRRARIKTGAKVEFKATPGVITIVSKPPSADDEYTPEQRRIIDAQLAEGLEDIRKGRVSPRFDTVEEMLASLKAGKRSSRRQKTRPQ